MGVNQAQDFVDHALNIAVGAPPVVRIAGFGGIMAHDGLRLVSDHNVPDGLHPSGVNGRSHQDDSISTLAAQFLSEKLKFVFGVRGGSIQEPDRRFRDAESLQHLPDEDVQASQGFKYTRPLRTILDLIEADTVERFFCPTGAGTGTPSWADHPAGDQDRQAEWLNPKSI